MSMSSISASRTICHAPLATDALNAGKHVVVEKPLTGFFEPRAEPQLMLDAAVAAADALVALAAERPGGTCVTPRTGCTRRRS